MAKELLFTADWHIKGDSRIWASRPEIYGDIEVAIEQLILLVKQRKPAAVLLGGDIFDSRTVTSYGISLFQAFVNACQRVDVPIYYIFGQHDISEPPLLSSIASYCQYIHERIITIDEVKIAGLNYVPIAADNGYSIPADLLLTHQVWKEFIGNAGIFHTGLIEGPKLILTGDYHFCRIVTKEKTLLSPGPLVMQAVNQIDAKCVFIVRTDGSYQRIELMSRPVYVHTILDENDLARVNNFVKTYQPDLKLPEMIRKPILLLNINTENVDVKAISDLPGFHVFTKLITVNQGKSDTVAAESYGHLDSTDAIETIKQFAGNDLVANLAISCFELGNTTPLDAFLEQDEE